MARPLQLMTVGLCVLLIGGAIYLQASKPGFENVRSNTTNIQQTPRHPVTQQMEVDAQSFVGNQVPDFELKDSESKPKKHSDLIGKGKPSVLVMTKDGCPCSIESQRNWTELANHYGDAVQFLAIMDAEPVATKKFKTDFSVPYPILSSPDDKVFRAFGAKQSVYVYLMDGSGKVTAVWPGYNKEMVTALNMQLSASTGKDPWKDEMMMVPDEMTSGCYFFQPVGTEKPAW
ncbi:MAG: redoxin domain-containing protein [Fimbriimonadaceae bacterium]|nr:MAG: redoxin domain-containing protein [Fimbriimonadaceae bacterium]